MSVRSWRQLRFAQAKTLEQYRISRSRSGAVFAEDSGRRRMTTAYRVGKITSVVTSDETYGPHLVVKPQAFSGRPPTPSDSSQPTRVVYPMPNLVVGNYAVDEYVALWITDGAEFAVKLDAERYFGALHEPAGRPSGWDQYVTL